METLAIFGIFAIAKMYAKFSLFSPKLHLRSHQGISLCSQAVSQQRKGYRLPRPCTLRCLRPLVSFPPHLRERFHVPGIPAVRSDDRHSEGCVTMCIMQVASARWRRGVIGQRARSRAVWDSGCASDAITTQWSMKTCADSRSWRRKTASVRSTCHITSNHNERSHSRLLT